MIKRVMTGLALSLTLTISAPVAAQTADQWRTVAPENLWVIDTRHGRVLVELMPEVAPAHVERLRALTRQGFYDGLTFHRVIPNFMAQGGDPTGTGEGASDLPDVPGEFTFRRGRQQAFAAVEGLAGAGVTGLFGPLPVQTQPDAQMFVTADGRVDATGQFCPGVVGMARGSAPDSANSQFFLMSGQNMRLNGLYTPVGVVLSGHEAVAALKVGSGEDGQVTDPDVMTRVRIAADLDLGDRPVARVLDPRSPRFAGVVDAARAGKGARMTICDIRLPVEVS